jgi:hypothetical protein
MHMREAEIRVLDGRPGGKNGTVHFLGFTLYTRK